MQVFTYICQNFKTMKANELRLGNIIEFNKEPFNVCVIYDNAIENESWCKPLNELHPIPLTKEWLVKFGFDGRKDFKWIGIVGVQLRDSKYYISLKDLSNVLFHSIVEIKYVHQLQNLYFTLTGEELTI